MCTMHNSMRSLVSQIWVLCVSEVERTIVKPPLVDSPNKGYLGLRGQHDMHRLNFSINLPTKDTSEQHRVYQCVCY